MAGSSTQNESQYVGGKSSPKIPGAVLVFSGNAPQLRAFTSGVEPLTVDREKLNLPDAKVSRPHAHIIFGPVGWTVRDLGSRNGTWVQGHKVEAQNEWGAASGQVVRCGASLFVLYDDVRRFLTGEPVSREPYVVGPTLKIELDQVALAAGKGLTVLIGGENGSGKEIAARTYHDASGKKGRFHAVNCAEIPKTVAEQLMFGVVRGAHSEAKADRDGHVQTAEGGTLFLDEIGELDLEVQAKLLRVLQTHEVMPLGATQAKKIDVRIVAATNRDLRRAVAEGTFRQDLFYRLAEVEVRVPALRERREEIPHLIDHTLREAEVRTVHCSLVEAALMRPWPGNVRELMSQVKAAAAKAHGAGEDVVRAEHLADEAGMGAEPEAPRRSSAGSAPPPATMAGEASKPSREQVLAALESNGWVKSKAQRALGLKHRTTFVRLIEEYQLKQPAGTQVEDGDE